MHLQKASLLGKAMKTIKRSTETINAAHLHVTMEALPAVSVTLVISGH